MLYEVITEHARGAVAAGVAFDEQQSAAHAVTGAVAGISVDDDRAAAQTVAVARPGGAEKVVV